MKIDWRVVGTSPGHVEIEYSSGDLIPLRLNFRVQKGDAIESVASRSAPLWHFEEQLQTPADTANLLYASGTVEITDVNRHQPTVVGAVPNATRYRFNKGDVLPEHKHEADTLHDILVVSGCVIVKRDQQGDLLATPGTRVNINVGELHSVVAQEPAVTLHTRLST